MCVGVGVVGRGDMWVRHSKVRCITCLPVPGDRTPQSMWPKFKNPGHHRGCYALQPGGAYMHTRAEVVASVAVAVAAVAVSRGSGRGGGRSNSVWSVSGVRALKPYCCMYSCSDLQCWNSNNRNVAPPPHAPHPSPPPSTSIMAHASLQGKGSTLSSPLPPPPSAPHEKGSTLSSPPSPPHLLHHSPCLLRGEGWHPVLQQLYLNVVLGAQQVDPCGQRLRHLDVCRAQKLNAGTKLACASRLVFL